MQLLCLLFLAPLLFQQPGPTSLVKDAVIEHGNPEELAGVKTVYIFTGTKWEVRRNIIKNLRKKSERFQIVESLDDNPDVVLVYGARVFSFIVTIPGQVWTDSAGNVHGYGSNTQSRSGVTGKGWALKLNPDTNTVRILWEFRDTARTIFERRPSTNFARNFVKVVKKMELKAKK